MPKPSSLLPPCIILLLFFTSINSLKLHLQTTPSPVTYDSLKAKFPTTIDYKYYDNLNAPNTNYYYGTITKEAYEMSVKLYKLDDYEQCQAATPYATKDMQSCMSCTGDRPLFNLGTRQCEQCRPNVSKQCDALFNVTTPGLAGNASAVNGSNTTANTTPTQPTTRPNTTIPGTVINPNAFTRPTTPVTPPSSISTYAGSSSSSPFVVEWQPKPKTPQKPVVNTTDAPSVQVVDIFQPVPDTSNDSLHENYTIEYRVSSNTTNTTTTNGANGTLVAQSAGQNGTFANQQCPALTPFYNPATKSCQNCKQNEQYVPNQKKCLPIVYVSNPKTRYVILKDPDQLLQANLNISKANPERTVRFCPIDRPLAFKNACTACPADKIFNFTSQECQDGCPEGQIFSEPNSKCINATFLTNSEAPNLLSPLRDFQEFRSAQKQRVKASPTIAQCPLSKPVILNGVCSICPDGLPFYNIESRECETCSRNREYNQTTRKCESKFDSGLEIKKIVPNIF